MRTVKTVMTQLLLMWLFQAAAWWAVLHSVRDGWRVHDIVLASLGLGYLSAVVCSALVGMAAAVRGRR